VSVFASGTSVCGTEQQALGRTQLHMQVSAGLKRLVCPAAYTLTQVQVVGPTQLQAAPHASTVQDQMQAKVLVLVLVLLSAAAYL
jgi:hypothetical protein